MTRRVLLFAMVLPLWSAWMSGVANGQLVHQWTFNGTMQDSVGTAHGDVFQGAQIVGGRLSLDGANDFFRTAAIGGSGITNKTLVSWVSLNTLGQAGGSALSLESAGGSVFDGIVYGERTANQWMAGSDFWNRSNGVNNGGAAETVTNPGQVMMAITYQGDNIAIYRNGALYASYNDPSQATFTSTANALFGTRHTGGGGAPLNAAIDEARIYNTVLTAGDIASLYTAGPSTAQAALPNPLHRWSFNDGTASDSIGTAHGTLNNGASIAGGQLQLDGINDYVRTSAINSNIGPKTLVAWTTLANLSQQSGGVLTLENPTGADTFDSIVYGERTAGQWMNGSNGFSRTPLVNNGGPIETSLEETMIAISYHNSGQLDIYRDGDLYATYMTGSPVNYPGGIADVLLGLRHEDIAGGAGTALGNDQFFAGFINEARIYGTDLTQDQIRQLFALGPNAIQPQAVPEPASFAVWSAIASLVGLCALVARRRK
jgi:hypothetical protein